MSLTVFEWCLLSHFECACRDVSYRTEDHRVVSNGIEVEFT